EEPAASGQAPPDARPYPRALESQAPDWGWASGSAKAVGQAAPRAWLRPPAGPGPPSRPARRRARVPRASPRPCPRGSPRARRSSRGARPRPPPFAAPPPPIRVVVVSPPRPSAAAAARAGLQLALRGARPERWDPLPKPALRRSAG